VFATLAGGYPWPPDLPAEAALDAVVTAQVDAGLELLADGRVHPADAPPDDLVAAWVAARDAAERVAAARAPTLPVKLAAVGPFAAAGPEGALEAARALNRALHALAEAGCPVVEIHEPAATLPSGNAGRAAFAVAHRALLAGLPADLHASLAVTGGGAVALGADALFAAPYRSHLFDLVAGPESWRLIALAPKERGIVAGVGDATGRRRTRIEDVVWAAAYAASTQGRGMDRVGIAPSGSLAGLSPARARSVLDLLGEAARTIAGGRDEALARLDPRAIDARSAALGHYRPARRRGPAGR
jgi:methionine synthase II (cobalamin-independent)